MSQGERSEMRLGGCDVYGPYVTSKVNLTGGKRDRVLGRPLVMFRGEAMDSG
jgi:hypothetical protein